MVWLVGNDYKNLRRIVAAMTALLVLATAAALVGYFIFEATLATLHGCLVFSPDNCTATPDQEMTAMHWKNFCSNTLFLSVPFGIVGILALLSTKRPARQNLRLVRSS